MPHSFPLPFYGDNAVHHGGHKVVLNLVDRRGSTTALAVVSTMKSLGGVIVTMIAGAVSNAYGRPAVFTLLLGIAAAGFILSALLKIPGNEQQLF